MDEILLPHTAPASALAVEGANDTRVFIQVPYLQDAEKRKDLEELCAEVESTNELVIWLLLTFFHPLQDQKTSNLWLVSRVVLRAGSIHQEAQASSAN